MNEKKIERMVELPTGATKLSVVQERAEALFKLLKSDPDGFTCEECCVKLDLEDWQFRQALRELRRQLGRDDSINVIVDPGTWRYRLVATYDEAEVYNAMRMHSITAQVETWHAICTSVAASPAGDAMEREKAAECEAILGFLLGRLERLDRALR